MTNAWVEELVAMADAVLILENEARTPGTPCRFCGSQKEAHGADCPVSVAERVVRQAMGTSARPH